MQSLNFFNIWILESPSNRLNCWAIIFNYGSQLSFIVCTFVAGTISSFLQYESMQSRGIGRPSILYCTTSWAHGKPCMCRIAHPQAEASILTELAHFDWVRIWFNAQIDMKPRSSLNSAGLKLCCKTVLFFSNEALMSLCCNSIKLCILIQDDSNVPWLDPSCLFNFACALSALVK